MYENDFSVHVHMFIVSSNAGDKIYILQKLNPDGVSGQWRLCYVSSKGVL